MRQKPSLMGITAEFTGDVLTAGATTVLPPTMGGGTIIEVALRPLRRRRSARNSTGDPLHPHRRECSFNRKALQTSPNWTVCQVDKELNLGGLLNREVCPGDDAQDEPRAATIA